VVISECGNSRRQIAYFGDTMNVAKRLEEHGQAVGRTLVASAALLERVRPGTSRNVKPLGRVELRGRSAQVDVFAIEGAAG
jgi:class 3 adenylate cyclase